MSVAIVTDSSLSCVVFSKKRVLKPDQESNPRKWIDVKNHLVENDIESVQFSYAGLKAFSTCRDGKKDRKIFLGQLRKAYLRKYISQLLLNYSISPTSQIIKS